MKFDLQKRLASEILKAGKSRVWIDPASAEEVSKAITREDVRALIRQKIIQEKPKFGISRGRARFVAEQRKKGRRKGHGQRKGSQTARTPAKTAWINKIRPLRRTLRSLRSTGIITNQQYVTLYQKAKGNFFRNVGHLRNYVEKMKE
jgi:large subunit ribosomal protein L19e